MLCLLWLHLVWLHSENVDTRSCARRSPSAHRPCACITQSTISPSYYPPPSPPQVMHASSVRSLHFVGDSLLYTASEDEVAQWNLPLF